MSFCLRSQNLLTTLSEDLLYSLNENIIKVGSRLVGGCQELGRDIIKREGDGCGYTRAIKYCKKKAFHVYYWDFSISLYNPETASENINSTVGLKSLNFYQLLCDRMAMEYSFNKSLSIYYVPSPTMWGYNGK